LVNDGYKPHSWNEFKQEESVASEGAEVGAEYNEDNYEQNQDDSFDDVGMSSQLPRKKIHRQLKKSIGVKQEIVNEELCEKPDEEPFQIDDHLGNGEDWGYTDEYSGGLDYQPNTNNSTTYAKAPKSLKFRTQPRGYGSRVGRGSRSWKHGGVSTLSTPNFKSSTVSASNSQVCLDF